MTTGTMDIAELPRTLGLRASSALIIGNILGMGIFLTPAEVAVAVEGGQAYLLHWLLGGAVALAGGLVVAELGVLFPRAGGDYVFLDRAFGRPVAVAWGWISLGVSFAASIAAMAVGLGDTLAALPALAGLRDALGPEGLARGAAVLAVLACFAMNAFSVPLVGRVQATLAAALLVGFAALGVVALGDGGAGAALAARGSAPTAGHASALAAVFFTYSGWNVLCYVGGDVRSPERTIPRAVLAAVVAVAGLYAVLNLAFVAMLGIDGLRETPNAGVALATRLLGARGGDLFGAAVALAIFAGINSSLMAASRVALALAEDGHLPRPLARLHPRWATPWSALLAVSAWVLVLLLSGSFGALVTLSGATMIGLSALSVASLFVFRRRGLGADARLPGYPWVPALYLLFAGVVLGMVALSDPLRAGAGVLAFVGLAVVVARRRASRRA